jgi:two-component system phosphate regulon sensor histidine kinase PhoR
MSEHPLAIHNLILEVVPVGILVLDTQATITLTNASAEFLLGANLRGKTLRQATQNPEFEALFIDLMANPTKGLERRFEHDRRILHVWAKFTPDEQTVVLTLQDETELYRLSRARREMVANISHELRTPITTISLWVDTLLDGEMIKNKKIRKILKDIRRETATLTQLAQEMRDLSLIESGQMPVKLLPTPLEPIVAACVHSLRPLAESKEQEIEVVLGGGWVVLADAAQLERVLRNLLHNAIKFTPNKGRIWVGARQQNDELTVYVRDNGPGLAPENLARVFERFFQADLARTDGTGLGLAIARHIILAHGGNIWVESKAGQGATFLFTLALAMD